MTIKKIADYCLGGNKMYDILHHTSFFFFESTPKHVLVTPFIVFILLQVK